MRHLVPTQEPHGTIPSSEPSTSSRMGSEKMHGWPPDITRPAQPLHNRVGVEHTPARLAKRKLIRARHTPFEFGPEAPDTVSSPQPCWPHRLRAGTVRLGVDASSRASS